MVKGKKNTLIFYDSFFIGLFVFFSAK